MSAVRRVFVDTNVFVYDLDSREGEKQGRAAAVLDALFEEANGVVSTQVLGELYAVATRAFRAPCEPSVAAEQVRRLASSWTVLSVTPDVVMQALRATERFRLPYFDAQVWAAAKLEGIPLVLSEDFSDGLSIEGVQFVDPFRPDFDLEVLRP